MIVSKTIKINDKNFTKTASDSGFYIERNSMKYVEAIDPLGSGREYTETDIPIRDEAEEMEPETTESRIVKLQTQTEKNTSDIEYIAMMTDTDLEV